MTDHTNKALLQDAAWAVAWITTALALRRSGRFPFSRAYLIFMLASDALLMLADLGPHVPYLYQYGWRTQATLQVAGFLAVAWEAAGLSLWRPWLALAGTTAFALATAHPHVLKLEAWFAALSYAGCFCGLYLLLGLKPFVTRSATKPFGPNLSLPLISYFALHAVLYSAPRESYLGGHVGLALNIGTACCMGWLALGTMDTSST